MMNVDWIAVDWGTTHLRAWAMSSQDQVIAQVSSDQGMGGLAPSQFEGALLKLIDPWLDNNSELTVIACGMVGSRQGWQEAPYTQFNESMSSSAVWVKTIDPRLRVAILPGVCQLASPDVMRGEETQILGALTLEPNFEGMLCLPGTHTKWAKVKNGQLVNFKTCMTGEIFGLLSSSSVLSHSVSGSAMDMPSFREGVLKVFSEPHSLSSNLFAIRAEDMLNQLDSTVSRAHLSGYLIGSELAGIFSENSLTGETLLIGSEQLSELYEAALDAIGKPTRRISGEHCTLTGLVKAKADLISDPISLS
jgi:2-dehydro-3-deoxygalactonokinase